MVSAESGQRSFGWFSCNDPGGALPSEDRVQVRIVGDHAFVWAIDGASSVDPALLTSAGQTGGAWHAQHLSDALARLARPDLDLRQLLGEAVAIVATAFAAENALLDWPRWALPLSAVSLVHLMPGIDGQLLGRGLHLADCPTFRLAQRVQALHEQTLPEETRVRSEAPADVAAALEHLKDRRTAQHDNPAPDVAGLNPACAAQARESVFGMMPGERLVVLTDGFARLWDEYALAPRDEILLGLTDRDRTLARIAEMRRHERTTYRNSHDRMLKSSDDAALVSVAWRAG